MTDAAPVAPAAETRVRVIGVGFLAQMIGSGLTTYSFGYFLTPIAEEFGTSRAAVASGQAIFLLVAALLLPVVGRVIDARPVRGLMAAGALLLGAAFAAISQSAYLWQAAGLAALVALGAALCGSLASTALVVRAFPAARERALGLASVGTSAGGFVFPLLAAPLIPALGWRNALLVLGVVSAAAMLAAAWFAIPRDVDRPEPREHVAASGVGSALGALRSGNFWAITLAVMIVYVTNTALIAHLPALAGDVGIPAAQRALIVPSLALASLAGKLVYSAIGDRFDARAPIWLAAGVIAPTLALLIAFPSFEVMLASAMANGLGTGSLLPAWAALIARCFGAGSVASVLGLSRTCAYPLMALGGVIAAWSKDATGSYDLAFQGFLLGALLVLLLPLGIRLPQRV